MKKRLLITLLAASSSCFAMNNNRKTETNKDDNKQVLDAGIDPMQAALLRELKSISSKLDSLTKTVKKLENIPKKLTFISTQLNKRTPDQIRERLWSIDKKIKKIENCDSLLTGEYNEWKRLNSLRAKLINALRATNNNQ